MTGTPSPGGPLRPRTLLHLSDPHFGTEQPEAEAALLRLVAQRRPALVVVSGDITQRATAAQFERARRFVQRLAPSPVLVIPGNHDIPLWALLARLRRPYARYQAALGDWHDREWRNAHCQVLALNTTRWWRHKHGELSAAQIADTAARLRAAPAHLVKLVVTHQPLAAALPEDRANLLRGHAQALLAWRDAGVDLVLGGHIHLPYAVPLPMPLPRDGAAADAAPPGARQLATQQAAARPCWVVQAGTAVSARVRPPAPNSVNELLLPDWAGAAGAEPAAQQCQLTFWDWTPGSAEFVARTSTGLALSPRRAGLAEPGA